MVAEETNTLMLPAPPALLVLPEICATAVEQAKALLLAGRKIVKAFKELAKMITEALQPVIEKAVRAIHRIFDAICRALAPKEWWHIYKHTKSRRIRKKYEKRIRERVFAILNEDRKE